jgi:hypothetical protein
LTFPKHPTLWAHNIPVELGTWSWAEALRQCVHAFINPGLSAQFYNLDVLLVGAIHVDTSETWHLDPVLHATVLRSVSLHAEVNLTSVPLLGSYLPASPPFRSPDIHPGRSIV